MPGGGATAGVAAPAADPAMAPARSASPLRLLPLPPLRRPQLHPVPHQHRLPLHLRRGAPMDPRLEGLLQRRLGSGRRGSGGRDRVGQVGLLGQWRRRAPGHGVPPRRWWPAARFLGGGRPPGPGVSFGAHVNRDDRRPHVDGRPLLGQQLRDDPLVRAGELHHRLGRFDLHDHLVERHRVARLDVPGDDVRLGQALTDVREPELLHLRHPLASQYANVRSAASSTRSRSGR